MFIKSWYVHVFTVIIFSFIIRVKKLITHLFKRLIYAIQNNFHQLTTQMSTLIMWHNRFSENENKAVEVHMLRHGDSNTKKPRHWGSKAEKPRHRDSETKTPRHRASAESWPLCPLIVNEFICILSTVLNTGTLSSKNALPVYRHLICLLL